MSRARTVGIRLLHIQGQDCWHQAFARPGPGLLASGFCMSWARTVGIRLLNILSSLSSTWIMQTFLKQGHKPFHYTSLDRNRWLDTTVFSARNVVYSLLVRCFIDSVLSRCTLALRYVLCCEKEYYFHQSLQTHSQPN